MKQLAQCVSDLGLTLDVVPPHCFAPIHCYQPVTAWTRANGPGPMAPAMGQEGDVGHIIKTTDLDVKDDVAVDDMLHSPEIFAVNQFWCSMKNKDEGSAGALKFEFQNGFVPARLLDSIAPPPLT